MTIDLADLPDLANFELRKNLIDNHYTNNGQSVNWDK